MKFFEIICILLLLGGTALAEDLIFFADDHYKALGQPELNVSVPNPVLSPGNCLLKANLVNTGQLEELLPINGNGSKDDIGLEMAEEMHSTDAQNIKAILVGTGPISVTSAPNTIELLLAGKVVELQFNISVEKGASGWYDLPLHLDYERQADVSVSGGEVSPLYQPENRTIGIRVFVEGPSDALQIIGTMSELYKGKSGNLMAVIKNDFNETLHNCSVRLMTEPPFYVESGDSFLGVLLPGALGTASFSLRVDDNAEMQNYQLGCMFDCSEKRMVLALPLSLKNSDSSVWTGAIATLSVLILAITVFSLKKGSHLSWRKRRW
jgi:hypothetical protein